MANACQINPKSDDRPNGPWNDKKLISFFSNLYHPKKLVSLSKKTMAFWVEKGTPVTMNCNVWKYPHSKSMF